MLYLWLSSVLINKILLYIKKKDKKKEAKIQMNGKHKPNTYGTKTE
jgi:hypothetical protein